MSVDWPGIVIGGLITVLVSLVFYVPSARGLRRESERLRRRTDLIMRGLEDAGLVEYRRDENGEVEGVVVKGSALMSGSGSLGAAPTVEHADPPGVEDQTIEDEGRS
jgi:hypothetical protein